jgi:hypothetical protein
VPVQLAPEELARLVDAAERPRADGWSFRAAIVRYAQPEPQRASAVIELLRRIEFALHPHQKLLERDGERLWAAVTVGPGGAAEAGEAGDVDGLVVGVLAALVELDRLGDELATWAVDARGERPDARVDEVVAETAQRLDGLGVAREDRDRRPPPGRRRG